MQDGESISVVRSIQNPIKDLSSLPELKDQKFKQRENKKNSRNSLYDRIQVRNKEAVMGLCENLPQSVHSSRYK